jgi:hypothetical protein
MAGLSLRLRDLGYRVLRTKTLEQGRAALADRRFEMSAALIPPDLPVPDLDGAITALRAGEAGCSFLATGMRPDAGERSLLRNAGSSSPSGSPSTTTLQFQINRALAEGTPPPRRRHAVRVPTNLPVRVTTGRREKQARVYCISAEGAYLATPRPSLPKAVIHFSLPLPTGELRLSGEVVMTNVPGNLMRMNLPTGMGVRFTGYTREAAESILAFTEARARALLV